MSAQSRWGAALVAAISAPLLLAGCVVAPEEVWEQARATVLTADDAIVDALVVGSTGPGGTTIRARLYLSDTDDITVERVIDAAFPALIAGSPARPPSIGIDIMSAPAPAEPTINAPGLDIYMAAERLGFADRYSNGVISVSIDVLEERYGRWEDLRP